MAAGAVRSDIIRPFLETTMNVLKTMAFIDPKPGKPFIKNGGGEVPQGDVSGLIGLAGEKVSGSMAIVFPKETILEIVSGMLGEDFAEVNRDVLDCVGELTNMISGGARAGLVKLGYKFEMAIPTMIQGQHHLVDHKTKGQIICIPFELKSGTFYIEATFTEH